MVQLQVRAELAIGKGTISHSKVSIRRKYYLYGAFQHACQLVQKSLRHKI